jgi:ParB family chromosome partitioning protein
MSETAIAVTEGLQSIALSRINPNPDNPRKHYDEHAMKELAASIRAQGVWEPIVLRPDPIKPTTFELVIGERRWRAAKLAGLSSIPAIVRNLTDRQALETMVIENLQREDVRPLEEAAGYRALLEYGADASSPKHTITSLAERISKSESYVHSRLKLLQLVPAAQEALQRDFLTAGHAVLIARLQPREQIRAMCACWNEFDADKRPSDPTKMKLAEILDFDSDFFEFHLLAEKGLRSWIQDNINLKLKGVPWDLEDATLLPDAGACSTCPKNSLANPLLFSELTAKGENVCFDPACYQAKRSALVRLQLAASKEHEVLRQLSEQASWSMPASDQKTLKAGQWLPAKKGECANVEKGVITKGEHAGETRLICADASCKVHKHNLDKPPASPKRESPAGAAECEQAAKLEKEVAARIVALLRKSVNGPDRAALLMLGEVLLDNYFYRLPETSEPQFRKQLRTLPLAKGWSQLIDFVLVILLEESGYGNTLVQTYAAAQKLDLKKAEAEFRKSYKAAQTAAAEGAGKGVSKKKSGGSSRPSHSSKKK